MKEAIEVIDKRMKELDDQFKVIQKQVKDAKAFIPKGEQAMGISSAAYNELENIKIALLKPKEVEEAEIIEENDDETSDNESED